MIAHGEVVLLVVGVVLAAIGGGAFFAFSNFVMPALANLRAPDGVRAMQAINRTAPNPVFVAALLLGPCAGVPVLFAERGSFAETETTLVAAAVALAVLSTTVTLMGNIPKNNRLDKLNPDAAGAGEYWARYLRLWTRDNTMRALASLASAAMYALAMVGR